MDDCNAGAEARERNRAGSDSSMDDCNKTGAIKGVVFFWFRFLYGRL